MKAFDLIDSISFGYKTVWQERRYLMKLAFVPVLIKLACIVVIVAFNYEDNYLRQALISLPAAFAEGWLLAQFLRTILLLERWPIILDAEPNENQIHALLTRARGIMASTILYALISFIAYGLKQLMSVFYKMIDASEKVKGTAAGAQDDGGGNPLFFIPALFLIYLSIWMFRFLWLYIPAVVLMPLGDFLSKIRGFMTSLRMIGIFLVSMIPCFVVAMAVARLLSSLAGGPDTDIASFITIIVTVLVETVISLIGTASMAYAFRDILPKHPLALQDIDKH